MLFRTERREFEELVRELVWLRKHNQAFGAPTTPRLTSSRCSRGGTDTGGAGQT